MFHLLCVTFTLFLAINATLPPLVNYDHKIVSLANFQPRIINGKAADKGQFPWQAAIFVSGPDGTTVCGGAIINEEWILTAGHCVYNAESFTVSLGSIYLIENDPNRQQFNTDRYVLHENYDSRTLANDIALIKSPNNIQFNDFIQPIELGSEELNSNIVATVSGWGLTRDGGDGASPVLNYVDLVTITNSECAQFFNNLGNGVVCARGQGSVVQSTCEGDSGGPLVINSSGKPIHVGIVSFGHSDGCESGKPTGFTRTSRYRNWIRSQAGIYDVI